MATVEARMAAPISSSTIYTKTAKVTSTCIRLFSFLFLRWALIPGFPAIIFTLFAVYVPSLFLGYVNESPYEFVDEIDVAATTGSIAVPSDGADGNGIPPAKLVEATEVVVEDTVYTREKPLSPWRALLTGAPNPRSLLVSALPLLVNLICTGMVADRLFREHAYTAEDLSFIRVGYVSESEAKFLIREPDQSKMPVSIYLHVKDPQAPFDNPLWQKAGGVNWTGNETDFTAVVSIPLRSVRQRTYEWKSSNNHTGEFTSAPRVGRTSDSVDGQFTFLSTSCIVNRLPYSPFDHPLSIPGMRHLAKLLPSLKAQFMLFLGDFIYVDVPHLWGQEVADYRQKYRQVYASPEWQSVGQNLSWIHVLDDHEISNDWSSNTTGIYQNAVEPWHHYQAAANPPKATKSDDWGFALTSQSDVTYFEFSQGPASFFLMDTRKYRSSNSLAFDNENKTMLGTEQLQDLLSFLKKPEPRGVKWKIIASSVPFTKNWRVNTRDTWGGFLVERQRILEAMWDVGARGVGVVVLSGDRHEFAATKFPPPADSKWPESSSVHEFSASPLSQFYSPIPSYRQLDNEDVMIKYINKGNSKFGAITIESLEQGDQSSLKYRLFVDGKEVWNTVVLSPPASGEGGPLSSFWNRIRNS